MVDKVDIAYFAGVLDSRAHIEPSRTRITVTTKRIHILEWLARNSGVRPTLKTREYLKRGCSSHCDIRHQHVSHESMYWTVRGERALIIGENVLPHLIQTRDDIYNMLRMTAAKANRQLTEIGAQMQRLGWALSQEKHVL
jgi:hypothetical protein